MSRTDAIGYIVEEVWEPFVWCVAWRPDPLKTDLEWCATFRNAKPSEDAFSDKTACGMFVTLRVGSEVRSPTCAGCLKRIARRRV